MTRRKLVGIGLAVAIVVAAAGLGYFFLAPPPPDTRPPHAVLTIVGIEGLTVTVSAEGSIAPRGEYEWNWGDGINVGPRPHIEHSGAVVTTITATHTYDAPGNYTIVLKVLEAPTGEFFTYFATKSEVVEIGSSLGPFITIDQSVDGVNWKLLFTEVPVTVLSTSVSVDVYANNGNRLLAPAPITSLADDVHGDHFQGAGVGTYIPSATPNVAAGSFIYLKTEYFPGNSVFRLFDNEAGTVLASGTLTDTRILGISVTQTGDGSRWVLTITAAPIRLLAEDVRLIIKDSGTILVGARITALPVFVQYVQTNPPFIAAGDSFSMSVNDVPAGSTYRFWVAHTILASGTILPSIGISVSRAADGLNWVMTFAEVTAGMERSMVWLELTSAAGELQVGAFLTSLTPDNGRLAEYVPIDPSSSTIQVGDKILILVSEYPVGTSYQLKFGPPFVVLAEGTLA